MDKKILFVSTKKPSAGYMNLAEILLMHYRVQNVINLYGLSAPH